jgi:hypothetical protein
VTLKVDSIVVFGSLEIGTPAQPNLRNASIELYGTRSSPTVVVDNAYVTRVCPMYRVSSWCRVRVLW